VSTLSQQAIDAACERFGHKLGWRFLTSPEHNFQTARVALVTINPGGAVYEPPQWSVENGSAYVVESWKGRQPGTEKLQSQVRRMFKLADVAPEDVLSGYFVPFRSPTWSALARKSESLHFAERLWREAFRRAENLQIVIAFGKDVAAYVAPLLDARLIVKKQAFWGEQTIDIYADRNGLHLIVLPHLSRFSLFGRLQSEKAFMEALSSVGWLQAERQPRIEPAGGKTIFDNLVDQASEAVSNFAAGIYKFFKSLKLFK
jgi:hypothetical protein